MEWISVKDRLPKDKEDVIVFSTYRGIFLNWRFNGEWAIMLNPVLKVPYPITHWMPLPDPPKEDENG